MPSQHGNGGQGGPWGSGGTPPDLEVLVRQAQDRLRQMLPGGGTRGLIALFDGQSVGCFPGLVVVGGVVLH
jgi:hypothetical protein